MLTAKRARGSQHVRSNSTRGLDRLEGLTPVTEDWHTKVCFYLFCPKLCQYLPILKMYLKTSLTITVYCNIRYSLSKISLTVH